MHLVAAEAAVQTDQDRLTFLEKEFKSSNSFRGLWDPHLKWNLLRTTFSSEPPTGLFLAKYSIVQILFLEQILDLGWSGTEKH